MYERMNFEVLLNPRSTAGRREIRVKEGRVYQALLFDNVCVRTSSSTVIRESYRS